MNKHIRQHNLQHGDEPKHPLTFGPPQPMDTNVKPSPLITKQANLAENVPHAEIDDGDAELSNMLASIETMNDAFLCAGSAEIHEGYISSNQGLMCKFVEDSDFLAAPGLLLND